MSDRVLVTAALPYANGSIHIGHLLEYIMTDVYVRGLKLLGVDAAYVCADDTHGTPIELNAQKAGVSPEEFIARFAKEHIADFERFEIAFDYYGSTNTEENRRWSYEIYEALKRGGYISRRPLDQLYDEEAQRFLPDRFVKGTCPNPACNAPDQYGDVCEVCGRTYEPTDLKDPYSAITGTRPVLKKSEHLFVDLSAFKSFLVEWTGSPNRLQSETKKFVDGWIEGGLRDWCISRDAPYFGFEIPDMPGKYFYVWLDAPIGYISSTERWAKSKGNPELADAIWRRGEGRVEHVIGKDIVYFHTLFWPAMLHAANLTVPSKVQVHGMITVDGVKMSKTRGTFINARTFAEHIDPLYLRYYYASKVGPSAEDVDLAIDEFTNRVNAELVNNVANLVSRGLAFVRDKLGGKYGKLGPSAEPHLAVARELVAKAGAAYRAFDLATAVRSAIDIAALGNKLFQDYEPWRKLATEKEATRDLVTLSLNLARAATVLLAPVVPSLAARVNAMFGLAPEGPRSITEATAFDLVERSIGEPGRVIDRIARKQLEAVIEASKVPDAKAAAPAAAPAGAAAAAKAASAAPASEAKKPEPASDGTISKDDFDRVQLRVGLVQKVETVEGLDRLYLLTVDLGEARPRTIFAGIRSAYRPEELLGRRVAVVANLKPRQMKSKKGAVLGTSEGMVLAAGPGGKDIWLLSVPEGAPPGAEIK